MIEIVAVAALLDDKVGHASNSMYTKIGKLCGRQSCGQIFSASME